jgi:hypothetical protein
VDAVSTPNLETIARCLTSYAYFCAELVGLEGRSHGSVCDDCADCCDRELISYLGVFFGSGFACLFAVMGTMSFFWSASLPLVEASTLSHLGEHTYRYERIRLWDSVGFVFAVVALGCWFDVRPIADFPWAVLGFMVGIAVLARRIHGEFHPSGDPRLQHHRRCSQRTVSRRP